MISANSNCSRTLEKVLQETMIRAVSNILRVSCAHWECA